MKSIPNSKPVAVSKDTPDDGGTLLDGIARMTTIAGSPSLDQLFAGGRNPFNRPISEVDRAVRAEIRRGGQ